MTGFEVALAVLTVIVIVGVVFGIAIWAPRVHSRMFPKGFDRSSWKPEPGRGSRFETMWTFFSGRGG